ncbi:hypothetical protein C8R47DRAFT_986520 [Mycena vitilis]|nr:hypothetical protein C8R47DRAFT_986520 [Mycena vitilis]
MKCQDDPMSLFPEVQQLFSDEILRRAGLGDSARAQSCALCNRELSDSGTSGHCYRCADCGEFLQCRQCCLQRHALSPLHMLEVWQGRYWKPTTLRALGLVYQLGHGGHPCKFPDPPKRTMVVIHESAVHKISYRFCKCSAAAHANPLRQLLRNGWYPATNTDPDTCATFSVLDLFRLLNVGGNVNAYDYIAALERKTDALASSGIRRDRYKAFARMTRQWAFLQRVRRAGRGNDPEGIIATEEGECSVICWLCPYEGRNMPENWRNVDEKERYIYKLILALDANFKMKNHVRTNEHYDPSLGPGWGAFVEPKKYRKHLRKYVAEKDISTCIAFAALMQKDTRNTAGLRVSGVGGCVCARHECMRPNGLGDLQKGERYSNMDYVAMSATRGFKLMELAFSYDIACQWHKNLSERLEKLPEELRLPVDDIKLQCGLPVWHASTHEKVCSSEYSLSFLEGLGRTDGEGVERLWSDLNPSSYHTKDMGIGNRADTIEDKIDSHNFLKNLGSVDILRRKLVVALAERELQVAAFKEINKTISSEVRDDWQALLDAWVPGKENSGSNPYILSTQDGPTEAEIRLELRKEEEAEAIRGSSPLHGTSATAFLAAGLQLEETQRRIKAELAGGTVTVDRAGKINEHRLSFLSKLRHFRELQRIYTPGAVRALVAEEAERDEDRPPPKAEEVELYLPSSLPTEERSSGCLRGLPEMEARLREAQCCDALVKLRALLHSKGHLIIFRNENLTGQGATTRSQSLVARVGARVTQHHKKYNQARRALRALKGGTYAPHLRKLRTSDLTLDGEEKESDTASRRKLARLGAGAHGRVSRNAPAANKPLSWIWMAPGISEAKEKNVHEALRVEWSNAKARKTRWEEEVNLLREEMRRVLRYLSWAASWWDERADVPVAWDEIAAPTQHGKAAYAAKQAATFRELREFYQCELSKSAQATIDSVTTAQPENIESDLNDLFAIRECLYV